ncbi:Mitochondrial distribution and morphology protein 31, mitochondrial precursor [Xylographa soralifera]|nr:Mitochondrial distribution and morphology protein 31, mitochondrial precursor [Xylographa soralifera]
MSRNMAFRSSTPIWTLLIPRTEGAARQRLIVPSLLQHNSTFTTRSALRPFRVHCLKSCQTFSLKVSSPQSSVSIDTGGYKGWPGIGAARAIWDTDSRLLEGRLGLNRLQLDRRKAFAPPGLFSRQFVHTRSRRALSAVRRNTSSSSRQQNSSIQDTKPAPTSKNLAEPSKNAAPVPNKHLIDRLPSIPHIHRPSKEELLAAATGFWSRLKVRFKWFSIRSVRPFNADEIGAFFSWILVGHVLWIILGTTTFFSLAIFAVNTVFAQETLARWIGNYLTKSSGIKVVFESAIVPKWGDGVITFTNVFVSRRPGQGAGKVSKGSPETAAAAAAATAVAEQTNMSGASAAAAEEDDGNYTQFDLSLETVNVTLSFTKWFNSKGLLRDVEVKGVRGVIDRTNVHYSGEYVDPRSYKHEHNPGDFEIDSFKMEDLLVTLHQPSGFRPFSISIFSCDLPQLRRQWLFYDFLSANMMSGSFDNSLFTIHPRQMHGHTGSQLLQEDAEGAASPWKKHSRLRIDGLNIDHLNRGAHGPFSWIHQGNVDIVADIMFPADNHESIAKVMTDFYERMEATVTSRQQIRTADGSDVIINNDVEEPVREHTPFRIPGGYEEDKRFLVMDLRVHLNDVRAAVPLFTRDISYVNNALIRPIVAYINSRSTFIPINCRVVKRASEFDGSWTFYDSGLMDDLSAEAYTAFARDVTDDQARLRRFRKVGLWSIQLAIQALFMGMAGNIA